jgi:selenocysteine lyase/cysteine desulfurase
MERISKHVLGLTELLLDEVLSLKHSNGEPQVRIYGPKKTMDKRGGTVAFNLLDISGRELPAERVAKEATSRNISVRTGCFCNPGAAEFAFGHEPDRALKCFKSIPHDCFTLEDYSSCMGGKAASAVRASLGIASNERDVERLLELVKQFRDIAVFASKQTAQSEQQLDSA